MANIIYEVLGNAMYLLLGFVPTLVALEFGCWYGNKRGRDKR
jgi:hypothetical protein